MYTLDDYLFFRGSLSFENYPVNELDEMIFACLGKPDYTGIINENGRLIYSDAYDA